MSRSKKNSSPPPPPGSERISLELVPTSAASALSTLSPIEFLARHRELYGYHTLNEIRDVLVKCYAKPSACRIVLHGPDTPLISDFPPAVTFLMNDVGFMLETDQSRDQILIMPGHHKGENSADWTLFQKKIAQGLQLIEWACWSNTSLLRIKLQCVSWDRAPSTEYGFQIVITWANALGKDHSETFEVNRRYKGASPAVVELYDAKCDRECTIRVNVYRKRMLVDRLSAYGECKYSNEGVERISLNLVDSSTPADVRGKLVLEIDSVRHRYAQLEAVALQEGKNEAAAQQKEKDRQESASGSRGKEREGRSRDDGMPTETQLTEDVDTTIQVTQKKETTESPMASQPVLAGSGAATSNKKIEEETDAHEQQKSGEETLAGKTAADSSSSSLQPAFSAADVVDGIEFGEHSPVGELAPPVATLPQRPPPQAMNYALLASTDHQTDDQYSPAAAASGAPSTLFSPANADTPLKVEKQKKPAPPNEGEGHQQFTQLVPVDDSDDDDDQETRHHLAGRLSTHSRSKASSHRSGDGSRTPEQHRSVHTIFSVSPEGETMIQTRIGGGGDGVLVGDPSSPASHIEGGSDATVEGNQAVASSFRRRGRRESSDDDQ